MQLLFELSETVPIEALKPVVSTIIQRQHDQGPAVRSLHSLQNYVKLSKQVRVGLKTVEHKLLLAHAFTASVTSIGDLSLFPELPRLFGSLHDILLDVNEEIIFKTAPAIRMIRDKIGTKLKATAFIRKHLKETGFTVKKGEKDVAELCRQIVFNERYKDTNDHH